MEATLFLARLIGIYCLVMGASMLKRDMMMEIFREVARQRAITYIMGALMLLLGLCVVLTHTRWNSALAVVVTVLGWEVVAESFVFLFASKEQVVKYIHTLENAMTYYIITAGYLIIGAYLIYNGFFL